MGIWNKEITSSETQTCVPYHKSFARLCNNIYIEVVLKISLPLLQFILDFFFFFQLGDTSCCCGTKMKCFSILISIFKFSSDTNNFISLRTRQHFSQSALQPLRKRGEKNGGGNRQKKREQAVDYQKERERGRTKGDEDTVGEKERKQDDHTERVRGGTG